MLRAIKTTAGALNHTIKGNNSRTYRLMNNTLLLHRVTSSPACSPATQVLDATLLAPVDVAISKDGRATLWKRTAHQSHEGTTSTPRSISSVRTKTLLPYPIHELATRCMGSPVNQILRRRSTMIDIISHSRLRALLAYLAVPSSFNHRLDHSHLSLSLRTHHRHHGARQIQSQSQ